MIRFVLIGYCCAGTGRLATAMERWMPTRVFRDLLDRDPKIAKWAYESYFGQCVDSETAPEYYREPLSNPARFVWELLYSKTPYHDCCGLRLFYDDVARLDLFDFLEDLIRKYGLKVLHVRRNPMVCLAARRQRTPTQPATSVWLDQETLADDLIQFAATSGKISKLAVQTVSYKDLMLYPDRTLRKIATALGLPATRRYMSFTKDRPKQLPFRTRIANLKQLRTASTLVVKEYAQCDDWW